MNVMAFRPTPRVYHSALVRRVSSVLRQIARRRGHHPTPPAVTPVSLPSVPVAPATEQAFRPLPQVGRVDDPYGEVSLIAVRGPVDLRTVEQLQDVLADLGRGRFVHLDLGNATIDTNPSMRGLEAIADDLERRGVVLRVVGLDPQHPMLSQTL